MVSLTIKYPFLLLYISISPRPIKLLIWLILTCRNAPTSHSNVAEMSIDHLHKILECIKGAVEIMGIHK